MSVSEQSCMVAFPRECNRATDTERATGNATTGGRAPPKPASLLELRMQLRAQQSCNLLPAASGNSDAELHGRTVLPKPVPASICLLQLGAGGAAQAFRSWVIRYADRDPVESTCTPPASHAEVLASHPGAIAAEPLTPTIRKSSAGLTAEEEASIRAWFAFIGGGDEQTIEDWIRDCERDPEALRYFLGRAKEVTA